MSTFAHFIHICLVFLTGLIWLPVYVLCIISASGKRRREELALLKEIARNSREK